MARLFVQFLTFYNNEKLPNGITFWQSRFTILQKLPKPSKVAWIYSSRFCISDNWSYLLIVSVNFVSDRERSSFSCQGNFCHFSIPTHCRFRKYDTSCYDMERKFLPKRRNFAQCCHTGLVEYMATHSNISSFPFGFYYLLDWVCALLLRLLRQMKSPSIISQRQAPLNQQQSFIVYAGYLERVSELPTLCRGLQSLWVRLSQSRSSVAFTLVLFPQPFN